MELVTIFFPIGGMVEADETLMSSDIRHYRHLVNYCVKLAQRSTILDKSAQYLYESQLILRMHGDIDEFSICQWDERAPLNKAH